MIGYDAISSVARLSDTAGAKLRVVELCESYCCGMRRVEVGSVVGSPWDAWKSLWGSPIFNSLCFQQHSRVLGVATASCGRCSCESEEVEDGWEERCCGRFSVGSKDRKDGPLRNPWTRKEG